MRIHVREHARDALAQFEREGKESTCIRRSSARTDCWRPDTCIGRGLVDDGLSARRTRASVHQRLAWSTKRTIIACTHCWTSAPPTPPLESPCRIPTDVRTPAANQFRPKQGLLLARKGERQPGKIEHAPPSTTAIHRLAAGATPVVGIDGEDEASYHGSWA